MTPVPAAVRALVDRAEKEFKDLVVCHDEISWRITKLSRAIRELDGVLHHTRKATFPLPIRPTLHESFLAGDGADEPASHHEEPKQILPLKENRANLTDVQLKRASRIALMEACAPASLHELYARIERRGSCDFRGCPHPLALLRRALQHLESEGEVQVVHRGDSVCWQRTLGHDRVAFPHRLHTSQPFPRGNQTTIDNPRQSDGSQPGK
jgi:hypothetical protein